MLDVISIGDVTEDVFLQVDEAELHCEDKRKACMLCLTFADKIPVKRVDKLIGGNAGNAAIGSARLGLKAALYAEVGDDDQGRRIQQSLKINSVATQYFFLRKGQKTNYSAIINYEAERTILVHHEPRKYSMPRFAAARWVYLTSMGKGSKPLLKRVLDYSCRNNAGLVVNPGTYQLRLGLKALRPVISSSAVTALNAEEAIFLLGKPKDFQKLCKALYDAGCRVAVVTDGPNGSYAYDGTTYWYCPIFDVPIIERTGCGDAYSTAFMAALAYGHPVQEAMRWGTLNAASVLQRIGPQEGLMRLKQLLAVLSRHPKFKAREFSGKEMTAGKVYRHKTDRKW
ncbi:carbohydrate kinase family protein [Candidatus Woesearchaeota archaeon]|nr:carbohydrate kinase family protein [Candidatus Woesearchaeota archaeon]